jgi:hypothetical protein
MSTLEIKVLRKKKLDKELSLKVTKNEASERIFVEFSSKDGKMVLQRSFQDTYHGRLDADSFGESIKSIDELSAHFKAKRI